ncbi:sensor histidine kinase [Bacillus sp. FJAT-28004]|uniref:sensor histidine kinase n=1 Tax=Bacillus sp. FJAT-28004 TaxID=1679165 RepID=UPI0006B5575D|nr:HAMP domain-containing sensor histidine kinase [Bacillus sp. FJAT-28004]
MKWRLTGSFLVSVVAIVILVVVMNIILFIGVYILQGTWKGPFFRNPNSPETITRHFHEQINISDNQVKLTDQGKESLVNLQAWIQVLDENGKQIFSYLTPEGAKDKYTPLDVINYYKYREFDGNTTIYIGEKGSGDRRFSYLMGFDNSYYKRIVLSFDSRDIAKFFQVGSVLILIFDALIALFIGYLFSKKLTKPLFAIIEGIRKLANHDYKIHLEPKGIYKGVLANVNNLSFVLEKSEMERKKHDRMKEEWIANISHDLKTPLASIQGYAEMMENTEYQFSMEEMREYAGIIERKSVYLKDVIDDLNLSTRLKNKELTLNKKRVNVIALLRDIVIDILNDTRYADRNLEFYCSDEVIHLEVDALLFRRTISNLIYNAIVHNDPNVCIQVSVEKDLYTRIRIEDTGKGIAKEELERIFDRYYRGTNTGELHKGSGLGMAIARDVVIAHGGKIRVQSQLGQGMQIEIQLRSIEN